MTTHKKIDEDVLIDVAIQKPRKEYNLKCSYCGEPVVRLFKRKLVACIECKNKRKLERERNKNK